MRNASLALLIASALAACSEAEPPGTAAAPQALPPPKPMVQAAAAPTPAPAAAPVAAPQPSADELLAARVKQALRDTRKVDGQGVDVRVAGGAVTLFGTASSAGERRKIEEFVAGLEGVQSVVSKLVIVRGS
ncbi:MAG: BON domain-containing protein [Betaproteobacteria bacterium]|nr:BON domain-containing protein [Betaproteobacteria bacterium]